MPVNLIVRNYPFQGVRSYITASQSGVQNVYYVEGGGNRYYYNAIGSTASPQMESATFESFISVTMSGAATYSISLVPMQPEETLIIDTQVIAINSSGSKAYVSQTFGGFRHTGSALTVIGGSFDQTVKSDFSTVAVSFTNSATASVNVILKGQTSETLDWDLHIHYKKGFHQLTAAGTNPIKPIYPSR